MPAQTKPQRQKVMRKGWTPPLWVNVAFGASMLVLGVTFTVLPQRGMSTQNKLLLLVAYCVVAGFYLVRAYRQFRKRREAG